MSNRLLALFLAGMMSWSIAGCGTDADTGTASPRAATTCEVGRSVLSLIPSAPAWWTDGPGPTLALACLHDRATGDAVFVGYASPESTGGNCVTAYNVRLRWSAGEKCGIPGASWIIRCEGAEGCLWGFGQDGEVTGMMGMLSRRVKEVRILVRGKPLKRGVMIARVDRKTARLVGAEEPFVSFAAFVPRCLLPRDVKVELLDAAGRLIETARRWRSPVSCPDRG